MTTIYYKRVPNKILSTSQGQKVRVVGKVKECTDNQIQLDTLDNIVKVGISQDLNVRDTFKIGTYVEIQGELISPNYILYEGNCQISQNFNIEQYNKTM